MNCRELASDEEVLPGDWWPSAHTGLSVAPNWFSHPDKGWCFRIDPALAKHINDWIWCGVTDAAGIYRDIHPAVLEDF